MKGYLISFFFAFLFSLLFCRTLIPLLKKWKAGQNILSYVKEHEAKSGTPTFGGIAFVLATLVCSSVTLTTSDKTAIVTLAIGLAYMLVGLTDDFLKKKHEENLGLTAWQKLIFQTAIAIFAGIYAYRMGFTELHIPFLKVKWEIGWWILPLAVFTFLATVNAVNLTDGLDGLAASACIPFFLALGVLIFLQKGEGSLSTIAFCLGGALSAYLLFNVSPARVFMGDTGSLSLGGFAACIGLFTGNALYILTIGITFVFSVISVLLQVIYYKATGGKRIFLMAPVHHHFQKKGHSETRISYAYFIITACVGLLSVVAAM